MSPAGEMGEDMKAMARLRRDDMEPSRTGHAKEELGKVGCRVEKGPDLHSIRVTFPTGKAYNFWPYTGWFAGPTQGRGLRNLISAGMRVAPKQGGIPS